MKANARVSYNAKKKPYQPEKAMFLFLEKSTH